MKYLIATLMMMFTFSAMAINTNGLTPKQLAELNLQVETLKATSPTETLDNVNEWINIGQGLGAGFASTAKELGITANELATTPVGMIAIVVIVWTYMGNAFFGILFGFLWFITAIPIWVWCYRARFVVHSVSTYGKGTRDDGLIKVK